MENRLTSPPPRPESPIPYVPPTNPPRKNDGNEPICYDANKNDSKETRLQSPKPPPDYPIPYVPPPKPPRKNKGNEPIWYDANKNNKQ